MNAPISRKRASFKIAVMSSRRPFIKAICKGATFYACDQLIYAAYNNFSHFYLLPLCPDNHAEAGAPLFFFPRSLDTRHARRKSKMKRKERERERRILRPISRRKY